MRKKMYWGIASLILIIGVVGVYLMLQPATDTEPEKKFIVPSEADLEKAREAKQPPREAKDGFEWEWHADHWHEVPIVQNEQEKQPGQSEPVQVLQSELSQIPGSSAPLFQSKLYILKDPEGTLRKNAAIAVADYHSLEGTRAFEELNLLSVAIDKGYIGGDPMSDEVMRLWQLKKELYYKPLEEQGILDPLPPYPHGDFPFVSTPDGGESQ